MTTSPPDTRYDQGLTMRAQALLGQAEGQYDTGQYANTVATTEAILAIQPGNNDAQRMHADSLRRLGRVAEATTVEQPIAHALGVTDLEGDWQGTYQCGPYIGPGQARKPDAWTQSVPMTIRNGHVTLTRKKETGDNAYQEVLTGDIGADLSLHLSGSGQYADPSRHSWISDFNGRFAGTVDHSTFLADGTLSNQHNEMTRGCKLAFGR